MAQKYENDESGEIAKFFEKVIAKNEEHKDKSNLNFLYAFRSEPKFEGTASLISDSKKLPNRDRDLFDYDVRVEICEQTWENMSSKDKMRIAYHELCHIKLEYAGDDESGELIKGGLGRIKTDKEGRICFNIVDHDIKIGGFKNEYKIFGISDEEISILKALSKIRKKLNKKSE